MKTSTTLFQQIQRVPPATKEFWLQRTTTWGAFILERKRHRVWFALLHCFQYVSLLPAATKLGQGNVFTSVCLSTGGRGVCLSACWDTPPPRTRSPLPLPGADPPREETPPGPDTTTPGADPPGSRLQHTVNERPVRIPLECILVLQWCVSGKRSKKKFFSL